MDRLMPVDVVALILCQAKEILDTQIHRQSDHEAEREGQQEHPEPLQHLILLDR